MSSAGSTLSQGATSLISAIRFSEKPVAFLVGSALSIEDGVRGVPGTQEMLRLAIEEAGERGPQLADLLEHCEGAQRYQAAMKFLQQYFNQDKVNAVVRKAVLKARTPPITGPAPNLSDLEKDLDGWYLPAATRDLGALVARFPTKFGPILTTNFDPLLKVAVKREGRRVAQVLLQSDGSLGHFQPEPDDQWIIHLHGHWTKSDTLHTAQQLTTERPHLLASLRNLLRKHALVVVGYGGWDDVFTRALAEIGTDDHADVELLWAFFDSNEAHIRADNPRLFSSIRSLESRGRFRMYTAINCHTFFKALCEDHRVAATVRPATRACSTISESSDAPATTPTTGHPPSVPPEEARSKTAPATTVTPATPAPSVPPESSRIEAPQGAPTRSPTEPVAAHQRKRAALPVLAFAAVLLAVGFAVTNTNLSTTAEPPPAVAVPIGSPKRPAPSENETVGAPVRARVPKNLTPGTSSNPSSPPVWDSNPPSRPATTGGGSTATETLRSQNQVRAMTRGATGFRVAQMPVGTFGFIPMDSVTLMQSASVEEAPVPGSFEVHKTNAGNIFLLGYVHPATAKAVSAGVRVNAILSPAALGVRTQLVSVPFSRISNAELRMDADKNKVLLLQLAGTSL